MHSRVFNYCAEMSWAYIKYMMKTLLLTLLLCCTNSYAGYYSTAQVCEIEKTITFLTGQKQLHTMKKTVSLRVLAVGSPQDYIVEATIDGWTISSRPQNWPNRYVDRVMTQDRIWVYESYANITSSIDINRISRVIKGMSSTPESRSEYTGVCRDAKPM